MKKSGYLQRTLSNNLYIMKLAWRLCPKRVAGSGIWLGLNKMEYLFFSGYFMKRILAFLESSGSYPEILSFLFGTSALFLFVYLFNSWYENVLRPATDVEVCSGLYHALYEKACNAELSCFEDSEFYNRYMMAMADSDKRLLETVDNLWTILIGTVSVAISWYMMIQIDPWIILFVLAPIIGNFVFAEAQNRLNYRIYEESVIFRRIADYVNRVIHLSDYAKELRMTNIFRVMQNKQRQAVDSINSVMDKYAGKNILLGWGYLYFTFVIIFEGVIFYGAYRTMVSKTMPLSDFAVLTTLMTCVSWILIQYTKAIVASFQNSLFIQNLRDFMEYCPSIPEDADGLLPDPVIHEIAFRNVSFSYKPGKPVLKNISFTLSKGETCALAGYNGAGKSTLIKLLLRFYDPSEGTILVNGIDIRQYNLKAYRALFSTAFQDGKIFALSIRDNVWMGKKQDASTDRIIWQALELAGVRDAVEQLPHGLDTVLTREFSEEGAVLSGGQCQKILAARAFARSLSPSGASAACSRSAPILIFDEPSSALDPIAEYRLMESIRQAGADKILLLISHRLSAISDVHKILLLKNGRIKEQGTHRELIAQNGEYAAFYRMQAEKYKADVGSPDNS